MPLYFKKELIALERYESAAFVDVNRDGVLDIVSGAWWYQGPDFKTAHRIYTVPAHDEYYDDFSSIALDITQNGYPDIVTGGWWGDELRWLENPGAEDKPWGVHAVPGTGNIETTVAADLDGDGEIEIIPNTPGHPLVVYKRAHGTLAPHPIHPEPIGHGLGVGDLAGHGRNDIVLWNGWLENPGTLDRPWAFHPGPSLFDGKAGVPIVVTDLTGDGRADLIVGNGHDYGLDWWENHPDGWRRHAIDPFNAQYHCLRWADLDGDGRKELVTGKRHRAHCGRDPGEADPAGIYYFKWTGGGFSKQVIDYGYETPLSGKGCGIQFDLADLDGNGLLSLVAPGKDGLYLYRNLGDREKSRP